MFDCVLFKDKGDMNQQDIDTYFAGSTLLGQMEKSPKDVYSNVTVLSVKTSKVGKTAFIKFPNLKWIVNRAHGYDNIDLGLCVKNNVGVIATYYTSQNCADWIISKVLEENKSGASILFGCGHIGKKVKEWFDLNNKKLYVVTSSMNVELANLADAEILIFTVPLLNTTINYIGADTIKSIPKNNLIIISISRAESIDNGYLYSAVKSGKVSKAHLDILGTTLRDELIDTGKVIYTHHTAWSFGKTDKIKTMTELKELIQGCISDNPNLQNTIVRRNL